MHKDGSRSAPLGAESSRQQECSQILDNRLALYVKIGCAVMSIDRRKAVLFGAAALLRLLLFVTFPSLPDLLGGRVEISTPVTSFKRCEYFLFAPLQRHPELTE